MVTMAASIHRSLRVETACGPVLGTKQRFVNNGMVGSSIHRVELADQEGER